MSELFMTEELLPHLVHRLRHIADIVGSRPEKLFPVPSTSEGLKMVLRSWQRHAQPAGSDHRAVAFSVTSPYTLEILQKISAESSLAIDEVDVPLPLEDEAQLLTALEEQLTPKTRLVVLEAMPASAPFIMPLNEAVSLCRRKVPQATLVVDASQAFMAVPLRLVSLDADVVVTSCHKWFCGLRGTGILHATEEAQPWIRPPLISSATCAHDLEVQLLLNDVATSLTTLDLSDLSSWLALDSVLAFWEGAGLEEGRLYARYLVMEAAEMLADAWGTRCGFPQELMGPMALVEIPPLQLSTASSLEDQAALLQKALSQRGIAVAVRPLSGRLFTRISAHIYNHMEEYEDLRDAVLELVKDAGKL